MGRLHAYDCGLSTSQDQNILEYARANRRSLSTLDADLHALLAVSGAAAPSVVRIRREGLRGPAVASLLQRVWSDVSEAIEKGAMVTVTDRSIRVRHLPVLVASE